MLAQCGARVTAAADSISRARNSGSPVHGRHASNRPGRRAALLRLWSVSRRTGMADLRVTVDPFIASLGFRRSGAGELVVADPSRLPGPCPAHRATISAVQLGALTTHVTSYLMERQRNRLELLTRWNRDGILRSSTSMRAYQPAVTGQLGTGSGRGVLLSCLGAGPNSRRSPHRCCCQELRAYARKSTSRRSRR